MSKRYFNLLFFMLFLAAAFPARAIVTFDVAQGAGNVVTSISDIAKEAGEKLKEVKKKAFSALQYAKEESKGLLEKVKQAQETYSQAAETVDKIKEDPKVKAAQASARLAEVQKHIKEIEQMKEDINAANAEDFAAVESNINGQIKVYEENNAALQGMIADDPERAEEFENYIAENKAQISALNQMLNQAREQGNNEISATISQLNEELRELKQEQRELTTELSRYVQDVLPDSADSKEILSATEESIFLAPEDPEDVESMDRLRRARQLERRNQAIAAFETLAALRQEFGPLVEEAEGMKAGGDAADSASGNIGMNTAIKTSVVKFFYNYAKQQVTVLKRETAREYAASTEYKRVDPDRDIAVFNLDDYKFELPEGVEGCVNVKK